MSFVNKRVNVFIFLCGGVSVSSLKGTIESLAMRHFMQAKAFLRKEIVFAG